MRGDTKSLRGLLGTLAVLAIYSDKERTGHKSISSGKPAAKSERDGISKERGKDAKPIPSSPEIQAHKPLQQSRKKKLQFSTKLAAR